MFYNGSFLCSFLLKSFSTKSLSQQAPLICVTAGKQWKRKRKRRLLCIKKFLKQMSSLVPAVDLLRNPSPGAGKKSLKRSKRGWKEGKETLLTHTTEGGRVYTWNGVQTFQRPGFTLLWPRSLAAKSRPTFFYPLASSTFFAHPRSKFPFFPLDPPGADLIFTARLSLRTQHGIFGLPCLFAQCEYIWLVASGPAAVDNEREKKGFLVQKIPRKSFLLQKFYRALSQVTMPANLAASFAHNMCKFYISFLVLTLVVARVKL